MTVYTLAPTDLTFLLQDCQRCFHHKVVNKYSRFYSPMPSVFNKIDSCMKTAYSGYVMGKMAIDTSNRTVKSKPIAIGQDVDIVIGGRMDAIGLYPQEGGGHVAVIDFKTSDLKEEYKDLYWRQLRAYGECLENPEKTLPVTVEDYLLISVTPEEMDPSGVFRFSQHVTILDSDDDKWAEFLGTIAALIKEEPEGKFNCPYCVLRNAGFDPKAKENRA